MAIPCIITVAITGSVPQKSDNPAVPMNLQFATINEQIEASTRHSKPAPLHICTYARSGAASSDPERIIVQLSTKLLPEATWTAAGIGRHQYTVNRWCLELGGHCRTGLEDRSRWLSLVFAIPHFSNSA
jgi:uncharacterized protein (DUF849 family)